MGRIICGIDEAGRGPIIGPLVMAGVLVREEDIIRLEKLGVKDSKLLTREKREELFGEIKKIVKDYRIKIIGTAEIDEALGSESLNLNWLEADVSASITNELGADKVFIDCPSVNIREYKNYFLGKLTEELKGREVVMEHKADLNYVVVGAASILAKVVRDREIEGLKKKFGVELGSGYLSDEKTQEFLKKNFDKEEYSELFRKRWQPYKELVKGKGQRRLGDF